MGLAEHPLAQLTAARLRELLREPEVVFWVFLFPVLLTLALGIAFRGGGPEPVAVGVEAGPDAERVRAALAADPGIDVRVLDASAAREDLRTGRVALVVVPGETWTYWYDPTRPDSRLARLAADAALQTSAGRRDPVPTASREMTEKGSRYIDFLVPGLVGMNLMGTGMWGIGFHVVQSRSRNLLKRLVATPMRRWHYLAAQIASRLAFLAIEVGVVVAFAHFAFDVPQRGSWAALGAVSVLGAMTFAGLGLLVASRARTIEGVSGLMNLVMVPMWVLSGIFFSTSRFPDAVQPLVQVLPLTAVIDALRAVMIDGATLAGVTPELGIAGVWCAASFAVALGLFRWT